MEITAYDLAQRFIGIKEVSGPVSNPMILAMLQLDDEWPKDDDVPWCSAFLNYVCWLLRLPRSKSLAARSWLLVGRPIMLHDAHSANDVVILKRPEGGPLAGHAGFFASWDGWGDVRILGGNQGNQVGVNDYDTSRVIGVRRLG